MRSGNGSDPGHDGWIRKLIQGSTLGTASPPAWAYDSYRQFRANVSNPRYPCYFGAQAVRSDTIFYSFVALDTIEQLPATLETFLEASSNLRRDKNNLVVFFEPLQGSADHAHYRTRFWDVLKYLAAHDPTPDPVALSLDTNDPRWEFSFGGNLFFVVGAAPSFVRHRSRNLGSGMSMIFQPRQVFEDEDTDDGARRRIRRRAAAWDGIASHPDLGVFGQPGNREWAQYFFSDDNVPEAGGCPLFAAEEPSISARDDLTPAALPDVDLRRQSR